MANKGLQVQKKERKKVAMDCRSMDHSRRPKTLQDIGKYFRKHHGNMEHEEGFLRSRKSQWGRLFWGRAIDRLSMSNKTPIDDSTL